MFADHTRRILVTVLTAMHFTAAGSVAAAALCGDTTGDGYLSAGDALATLRLAVRQQYDRRGDVVPAGGDSVMSAGDALVTLRSVVKERIPSCSGPLWTRAVATTAPYDFTSAGFAVVALEPDELTDRSVRFRAGSLSRDAVVRAPLGIPIVINRYKYNTLRILDVDDEDLPTIKVCSVSGGFNSNPQDVALVSPHKGYVTAYEGAGLFVIKPAVLLDPDIDPACSGMISGQIDLSSYDEDGFPEMDQMALLGNRLFVSMQLLDSSHDPSHGPGRIAVVDTKTDKVETTIPLSFENPFAATKGIPYDEFQNRLFVGGPGNIRDDLDDGGIEAIDPSALQSAGVVLSGADIHANIFDFVIVGTSRAFAIIADHVSNSVVDIDLEQRSIRKVLLSSTALITDIEMTERGELWVAYRGESESDPPGIRIFRTTGSRTLPQDPELTDPELTESPIAVGQPPFTLTFIP